MIDIVGISSRFVGDLLRPFKDMQSSSAVCPDHDTPSESNQGGVGVVLDQLAAEALTTVFGMDAEGRIKKEKAKHVVEKLGLIEGEYDKISFELIAESEEELRAEEIIGQVDEDALKRLEFLRRAFTVFDEDGDGFIDALEIKRVLECLGLANSGWDMEEFQKMIEAVDLNFDGKVDFSEFQLMMGEKL